jgi:mannose-6-phosphate isomerase-like protein (cupin superfamily)
MKREFRLKTGRFIVVTGALIAAVPALSHAQAPTSATYLTAEQIQAINALPGADKQIVITDIGKLNLAVGMLHRGALGALAAGTPAAVPASEACGVASAAANPAGWVSGLTHEYVTETYIITSGAGTLVTGGHLRNGRLFAPDNEVTTTLAGLSCSGAIDGSGVVSRDVKVGDVIVIPAGVPHGWSRIPDHVDYLSIRPDPDRVLPGGYVHPALD